MNKQAETRRMALHALKTPIPADLLKEPVEFIFADHFRQRTLCSVIDGIAEAEVIDKEPLEAVLQFLKSDFGFHILDEEEDLFPLLRKRAESGDEIEEVLDKMCEEHTSDKVDASEIIDLLDQVKSSVTNNRIDRKTAGLLKRFAANERLHLIVENAIVLPFARKRLTDADMLHLGKQMAERRGVELKF
ncbi:MAG: hemerythrin domain-containing protein [Rhizobiaceae bacterium]